MRLVYFVTTGIQLIFIVLVFLIVFSRPHNDNQKVLGLSIEVEETLKACQADLNHDSFVDVSDYLIIEDQFLVPGSTLGDINKDNTVDITDFSYVLSNFGRRCI